MSFEVFLVPAWQIFATILNVLKKSGNMRKRSISTAMQFHPARSRSQMRGLYVLGSKPCSMTRKKNIKRIQCFYLQQETGEATQ